MLTSAPKRRLYALSGESRKLLVAFTLLSVAHAALGVTLIVLARNTREGTVRGEYCGGELTYQPRIASFLLPTGPRVVCIPDSSAAFGVRVAYSFSSLAYGKMMVPPGLTLCAPKCSYHRRGIVPDSDSDFLLDVWREVELANDPGKDHERFGSIFLCGFRVAPTGGSVHSSGSCEFRGAVERLETDEARFDSTT